jgi:hypothetical protein
VANSHRGSDNQRPGSQGHIWNWHLGLGDVSGGLQQAWGEYQSGVRPGNQDKTGVKEEPGLASGWGVGQRRMLQRKSRRWQQRCAPLVADQPSCIEEEGRAGLPPEPKVRVKVQHSGPDSQRLSHICCPKAELSCQPARPQRKSAPSGLDSCRSGSRHRKRTVGTQLRGKAEEGAGVKTVISHLHILSQEDLELVCSTSREGSSTKDPHQDLYPITYTQQWT